MRSKQEHPRNGNNNGQRASTQRPLQPYTSALATVTGRARPTGTVLREAGSLARRAAGGLCPSPSPAVAATVLGRCRARPRGGTTRHRRNGPGSSLRPRGTGTRSAPARIHIQPRARKALQHGPLVPVDDRVVRPPRVVVGVARLLVRAGPARGVVALDLDLPERGKVVAEALDVGRVPVDRPAGPVDGALGVGVGAARPDGELHAGRRLREVPLVGRRVPRLGPLLGAPYLAVDEPGDVVGGPADLVVVEVGVGVGQGGDVAGVLVCVLRVSVLALGTGVAAIDKLTVGNALEIVVCLGDGQVGAHPLVVDLVLHVAEQDESRDHTRAPRRLDSRLDVSVPHVVRRGEDGTDRLFRHGEEDVSVVEQRLALGDPVGLAGVAVVLGDVGDAV